MAWIARILSPTCQGSCLYANICCHPRFPGCTCPSEPRSTSTNITDSVQDWCANTCLTQAGLYQYITTSSDFAVPDQELRPMAKRYVLFYIAPLQKFEAFKVNTIKYTRRLRKFSDRIPLALIGRQTGRLHQTLTKRTRGVSDHCTFLFTFLRLKTKLDDHQSGVKDSGTRRDFWALTSARTSRP